MCQDIETVSELSAGQTVCDVWHQSNKPKNAHVVKVCFPGVTMVLLLHHMLVAENERGGVLEADVGSYCRR